MCNKQQKDRYVALLPKGKGNLTNTYTIPVRKMFRVCGVLLTFLGSGPFWGSFSAITFIQEDVQNVNPQSVVSIQTLYSISQHRNNSFNAEM